MALPGILRERLLCIAEPHDRATPYRSSISVGSTPLDVALPETMQLPHFSFQPRRNKASIKRSTCLKSWVANLLQFRNACLRLV
jgi:hypothetical protein